MAKAIKKVEQKAMTQYQAGINDGFEDADANSFAIPRLKILQKMSPEVDKDASEYVDKASAGDFFNTATGLIYDGKAGITVIPVHFRRSFIEWVTRDAAGCPGDRPALCRRSVCRPRLQPGWHARI